jgi:hypothetical protein
MLDLKVGDRVRSREDGATGTVMRCEHDFEHPRYVIAWDDGEQIEIWPNENPNLEELLQREPEEDSGSS